MVNTPFQAAIQSIRGRCAAEEYGARADIDLLAAFLARQDQAAFAALVRRHGPMVLAACRRILGNDTDADDAFQATFLLLARKAAAVRNPEAVACWLYGVADRVARKARSARVRRQVVESNRPAAAHSLPDDEPQQRDLRAVLDEELNRLPAKYRDPLVLCYLQGLTNQVAADRLGWKLGTLWGRMARARQLLRRRLEGRGLTLSVAGMTSLLLAERAGAAVGDSVISTTVALAAGQAHGPALALTQEVLRAMFLSKLKAFIGAACLAVAICTAGVALVPGSAPSVSAAPGPKDADADKKVPPFDGAMKIEGQKTQPSGGKVILYSRNRYGNYPVATYDFTLGLRGDDAQVANYVDLLYGNRMRAGGFEGKALDGVPGVNESKLRRSGAAGAAGMDAGPGVDEFKVGLHGPCRHAIVDLGKIDFAKAKIPAELATVPGPKERRTNIVPVVERHVYVIHLYEPSAGGAGAVAITDRYVKLKVLRHQDNDAVEIEWTPLDAPKR